MAAIGVGWRRSAKLVALMCVCVTSGLAAQTTTYVRGSVSDSAGRPLAGALVAVSGAARESSTLVSATGRFVLRAGPGTRLVATRIGFAPETLVVAAGEMTFRLLPAALVFDPILVAADRSYAAASASYISQLDIAIRTRESSQDLLRLVPGLVIAQHAGGGKAEQIFLRGFDADHGTDVAVSVDGAPVNLVSHAHGQGYADLHWLMPEVVTGIDVRKGPYDASDGDFATAGAVAFTTLDRLAFSGARLEGRGGSFGTAHVTALVPFGGNAGGAGGYLAGAMHRSDGPFETAQDYRRYNVFAKASAPIGPQVELVASADAFAADWNASGQVPERAVAQHLIGRFGAIDPFEGGSTWRQGASLALRSASAGPSQWDVRAFVAHSHLTLNSDFTFFLDDTTRGDGIQQADERVTAGWRATHARRDRLFGAEGSWDAGAGMRADWIDLALSHQQRRVVLERRIDDRIRETAAYAWLRQALDLTSRLRIQAGLRGDVIRVEVRDRLAGTSGSRWRGMINPKLSVVFDVTPGTQLFLNAAGGFHSNDARDVVLAAPGERVLPRAWGAEIGTRRTWSSGSVSAAAWLLDLQSELV